MQHHIFAKSRNYGLPRKIWKHFRSAHNESMDFQELLKLKYTSSQFPSDQRSDILANEYDLTSEAHQEWCLTKQHNLKLHLGSNNRGGLHDMTPKTPSFKCNSASSNWGRKPEWERRETEPMDGRQRPSGDGRVSSPSKLQRRHGFAADLTKT